MEQLKNHPSVFTAIFKNATKNDFYKENVI